MSFFMTETAFKIATSYGLKFVVMIGFFASSSAHETERSGQAELQELQGAASQILQQETHDREEYYRDKPRILSAQEPHKGKQ